MNKIKTIGILAHVDAGKTSLTEALLFQSGTIEESGSVDKGSTITDGLRMEKERGISIKSSTVDFQWEHTTVQIVDTPGHIDFSSEVDRALDVLDVVVLVVSAAEGVQAHTLALWESMRERNLPVLFFVNKIDRSGADSERVFREIEKDLKASLFAVNFVKSDDPEDIKVVSFDQAENDLSSYVVDKSLENLAEVDERFLEQYLDGELEDLSSILTKARAAASAGNLTMILFGSAKLQLGISSLLHEIVRTENTTNRASNDFHARIFKVTFESKVGRLAHIRLYNGTIKTKDVIPYSTSNIDVKVNQIFKQKLGKLEQVKELHQGEIGVISTSEVILAGTVLGTKVEGIDFASIHNPVLIVQVIAKEEKDYQKLGEALELLNIEDPRLNFQWFKEEREYQLNIMGPIQTEILRDNLWNRYGIDAEFMRPQVIYKETPTDVGEGFVRYWMPKPCWAIMKFRIEPGKRGSGWVFDSKVRTSDISQKYQNEIIRAIPWSLRQGIKGWEVTDIKITLLEGSEHNIHSNPGDFLLATPMGIMRGLENAQTTLLEPMYKYTIKAHSDYLSKIVNDLNQMKASIGSPTFDGEFFNLEGRVSVEQSLEYGIQFNASTSGKGRLKLTLDGYEEATFSREKERSFKGVSPLDESLWILHNRGAFKAEDRKR